MKTWALVVNNIVWNFAYGESAPTNTFKLSDVAWIDVTNLIVERKYLYNKNNNTFSQPAPDTNIIPRTVIIKALDKDYNEIVSASENDLDVKIWLDNFLLNESYDLLNPSVISNLQFLVTKGLTSQGRIDRISLIN